MSITLFGTCRINNIIDNNNINNLTTYTHTTKEVLQLIYFLMGHLKLEAPLDKLSFRTGIVENRPVIYDETLLLKFTESTTVIIEICSNKTYVYDNYYLHHLCVDKRWPPHYQKNTPQHVLDNYKCIKQTPDEIESDLLKIKDLIKPRKMILVTHYNSIMNGKYIESRNNLIILLNKIAKTHNISIVNPSEVLKDYTQEEVMKGDLGHYTDFGMSKITEYLNNYIRRY